MAVLRSSRYTHHRAKFDPYARFLQYMARTPNDASLVTELRLHDFYLPISGSWLTQDEVLVPAILNVLPNLESLVINCLDTSLSRAIMTSLRKLIATPHLLNISFSKVLFRQDSPSFLSLFKDSVAPKNIQVHGGLAYYRDIDDMPSTGVNPINSLAIKMYPSAAADFVDCLLSSRCPFDLLTLKRLEIYSMWMKHAGIFNRLLCHLKNSLEELVVHTSSTCQLPCYELSAWADDLVQQPEQSSWAESQRLNVTLLVKTRIHHSRFLLCWLKFWVHLPTIWSTSTCICA